MKRKDPSHQQTVAANILEEIKYPLIHFADHLRNEEKTKAAGDLPIDLLTALLSISHNIAKFFPVKAKCQVETYNNPFALSATDYVQSFLKNNRFKLKNLFDSCKVLTKEEKSWIMAGFATVEKNKAQLVTEIPFDSEKYLYIAGYGENPSSKGMLSYIPHAKDFPCFMSFSNRYISEYKYSVGRGASMIYNLFFVNKTSKLMFDIINDKEITCFKEVLEYALEHPTSRSAQLLKNVFGIDFRGLSELLNKYSPLAKDTQNLVLAYTHPFFGG